jgi:hypothetical protein
MVAGTPDAELGQSAPEQNHYQPRADRGGGGATGDEEGGPPPDAALLARPQPAGGLQ